MIKIFAFIKVDNHDRKPFKRKDQTSLVVCVQTSKIFEPIENTFKGGQIMDSCYLTHIVCLQVGSVILFQRGLPQVPRSMSHFVSQSVSQSVRFCFSKLIRTQPELTQPQLCLLLHYMGYLACQITSSSCQYPVFSYKIHWCCVDCLETRRLELLMVTLTLIFLSFNHKYSI